MSRNSNDLYKRLMKEAQKEKINLANGNARLLLKMYEDIALDINKRLRTARGGFTKAWLKDFDNYIEFRYNKLNEDLTKLTKDGIIASAEIASAVEGDFLSYVNNKYELDIDKKYIDGMYQVNQNVILKMISGEFYKNNAGVSKSIWSYSEKNKGDINYIIAKGMAEQKDFKSMCKDLELYVKPSAAKDFKWKKLYPNTSGVVDFNAQRLLRTSINHTFFNQTISNAKKNPFVSGIHWELSAEHYERQVKRFGKDICDQYAEQNKYGLGPGNFPKDKVPVPHPQCLCHQYAILSKSLEDIGKELHDWVNGSSNKLLDDWVESKKQGKDFDDTYKNNVSKDGKDDIISNEELFRKKQDERKKLKFISDAIFDRLTIKARKSGALIIRGTEEVEKHLDTLEASASNIGDILLFRKNVCISDVLEETYHFEQNLRKQNDDKDEPLRSILNEIDAKEYLINNSKRYKIPRNEIELTKKQLAYYKKQLKEIMGEE